MANLSSNSNNNDGVSWMNTNPYMYHSNNNNDEVSWMNTTPYMNHGNNNNNNGGVLRVNPAPQDSIQNLERFTIEGRSDSSNASSVSICSICLDDLSIGSEATRMPCSHVYHNHCIVKWLKTCNTCPLCRSII
ncbi:unnamed protein product [Lupinus luteus]|uniref:RING-type domain-containing protein n=1 Tax=Lupinus luteus TaxID=3873 RepID=A0AAV1YLE3_LUPLU